MLAQPSLLFRAQVRSPQRAGPDDSVVATHLNVYRGLDFEGAKGVPSGVLRFDVALRWGTRALFPLETTCRDAVGRHATTESDPAAATTVFLDFLYSTPDTTEYRFGATFDVHDLIAAAGEGLTLTARNNNTRTQNPELDGVHIPEEYTVHVALTGEPSAEFLGLLAAARPVKHSDSTSIASILSPTGMEKLSTRTANWVANFLDPLLRQDTPFRNIRSFLRTPGAAPLFTQLPSVWQQAGSTMPAIMLPYLVLNSLLMNDACRDTIVHDFPVLHGITGAHLLRVIRDAALGPTMCKHEGKYFADTLYGRPADDQPFVDGMHNDLRVFARDDCEGRLQQGVKALQGFVALAELTPEEAVEKVHEDIAAGAHILDLDDELLLGAVRCAHAIGSLLAAGVVTFHMDVGEACFKSYPKSSTAEKRPLCGHSFGQLCLMPDAPQTDSEHEKHPATAAARQLSHAMHIVEATGWMDEFVSTPTSLMQERYRDMFSAQLAKGVLADMPTMRSCTTPEVCSGLYCYVYMCDGDLVFQRDAGPLGEWHYGAHPSAVFQPGATVVRVSPRRLLHAFEARQCPHATQPKQPPPDEAGGSDSALLNQFLSHVIARMQARRAPILAALTEQCPAAHRACRRLERQLRAIAPFIHPPPDPLPVVRHRLSRWIPIKSRHVPTAACAPSLVAFSTTPSPTALPSLRGHTLQSHPFMRSWVHLVRAATEQ